MRLIIVFAACLLFLIYRLFKSGKKYLQYLQLKKNGIKTEGVITLIEGDEVKKIRIHYGFEADDYSFEGYYEANWRSQEIREGVPLEVYYDKENPEINEAAALERSLKTGCYVDLILTVVAAIALIILLCT